MTTPNKEEQANIKIAQLLKAAFENMQTPAYREHRRLVAHEKMSAYKSYIEAGFTESQAIELVKAIT